MALARHLKSPLDTPKSRVCSVGDANINRTGRGKRGHSIMELATIITIALSAIGVLTGTFVMFLRLQTMIAATGEKLEIRIDRHERNVDARFEKVDKRFDKLEREMDERFDKVDGRFNRLERELSDFRIETRETLARHDERLAAIERQGPTLLTR